MDHKQHEQFSEIHDKALRAASQFRDQFFGASLKTMTAEMVRAFIVGVSVGMEFEALETIRRAYHDAVTERDTEGLEGVDYKDLVQRLSRMHSLMGAFLIMDMMGIAAGQSPEAFRKAVDSIMEKRGSVPDQEVDELSELMFAAARFCNDPKCKRCLDAKSRIPQA